MKKSTYFAALIITSAFTIFPATSQAAGYSEGASTFLGAAGGCAAAGVGATAYDAVNKGRRTAEAAKMWAAGCGASTFGAAVSAVSAARADEAPSESELQEAPESNQADEQ